MNKKAIAVIFGGCSTEYKVSLQSAYSIIKHLNTNLYEIILLGITKEGQWMRFQGNIEKITDDTWFQDESCTKAIISPDRLDHGFIEFRDKNIKVTRLDAVFPVLHGKNGEDGTVQGLIELAGIPIIGCTTLSSALCMDKDYAHKIVSLAGIKVPRSLVFQNNNSMQDILELTKDLNYPLFVKPVKSGSSFGITKVAKKDDLMEAIKIAFQHDDKVVIEENIEGFEVGCAVLGTKNLLIGEVDEIELSQGFFDFTEKYTLQTSNIHMPARIRKETADRIKNTALTIYKALGCSGFARVDMFLTPEEEIVFNEVNTIPGFTSHSRYPNMLKGAGMTYEEILNTLIAQSLEQ